MSSKRGRKRNDNLPPNRARDVQRAFRARRAAHLEALESRVAELEEENNALRAALNLPPANRPPLGKGPTGKDKPKASSSKAGNPSNISSLISSLGPNNPSGAPLSRTESPLSTGSASGHSMSPDPIAPGPVTTCLATKTPAFHILPYIPQFAFPQLPRSVANDIFPSSQAFPSSDEKSFGYLPTDERRSYNYSHPLLSGHPSAQGPLPSGLSSSTNDPDGLAPFLQRRALTEPDGFRSLLNQMSHVQTSQNGLQTPAPRMSQAALLSVVDAPLTEYDLPGGAERRYPRLH
uniref:Guanine nucleotide-binding protein alpha-4 subunit n=1 Tax=Ganoderma boninense TaxID=34458 RepID=A0A5K1JUW9_9APHY|nr:Guanine nucleotide-binding protein alpha-4 subunit [Ganoderma boninense]